MRGVCVCIIWTDVKLLLCGGSDRVCGITANEDAHILWWCIGRRPDVYLQNSVWTVEQAVPLLHCCRNLKSILVIYD